MKLPSDLKISPSHFLGALGLTGRTAYYGLLGVGAMKEGDAVFVSAAAGATGSVVGGIAKARGASRVVGTAGADDKCRWLTDECGFDSALNYKVFFFLCFIVFCACAMSFFSLFFA